MNIGRSSPRHRDYGDLYPGPSRLQDALYQYLTTTVNLCRRALVFVQKHALVQLSTSFLNPFDSEFGSLQRELERMASEIRQEADLKSKQLQVEEARFNSRHRALAAKVSSSASEDLRKVVEWKQQKAEARFLEACSIYKHQIAWKQARKKGSTNWISKSESYKHWLRANDACAFWLTGKLGAGKTVVSANVIEDLIVAVPDVIVAYFFCRHDEAESLSSRTIIGSLARQVFENVTLDAENVRSSLRGLGTEELIGLLQELHLKPRKVFLTVDGIDECQKGEIEKVLDCLNDLHSSKTIFRIYLSSRPDVFTWASKKLSPRWHVPMPGQNPEIASYIADSLVQELESERLQLGNPAIIVVIQEKLTDNAHGMFVIHQPKECVFQFRLANDA